MANSGDWRAFSDSFMRGYSFIDDIKDRNRRRAMEQQRLQEERDHRAFLREQAAARTSMAERELQARESDRIRGITNEQRERAARSLVARGATAEELADFADTNAGFAELSRLRGENEAVAAARAVQGFRAPAPGATAPAAGGLTEGAVGALPQQPGQAPTEPMPEPQSLLAPSRGVDAYQFVSPSDTRPFDETAPTGFLGAAGETVQEVGAGAANFVQRAGDLAASALGLDRDSPAAQFLTGQRSGARATGRVAVPEAYVTPEEMALLEDPAEIEAARANNAEIMARMHERAQDPEANRVTRLNQAGQANIAEAELAQRAATERYAQFLDPTTESGLRTLAAQDPGAAATQYFQDRATLNAADPQMRAAMDRAMQAPLNQYEDQIKQEIVNTQIGTAEHRRQIMRLRNLQMTRSQIYDDYKPSEAIGVDRRGFPVGNRDMMRAAFEEANNPERPRPSTPASPSEFNATATSVTRMSGGKRLTDTQVRQLIKARDYGIISEEDFQHVLQTGQLPSGSQAMQLKSFSPDEEIWGFDPNTGGMKLIRPARAKPGGIKTKGAGIEPNQVTNETLDNFERGVRAAYPAADDAFVQSMQSQLLDNADFLSKRFDFRNQQSTFQLGQTFAQYEGLAAAENQRRDNELWPGNWFSREDLRAQDLLADPKLRMEIALNNNIVLRDMPEIRPNNVPPNFDAAGARAFLASGDLGPAAAAAAETLSDYELYVVLRREGMILGSETTGGE